ncbi:hypothetical protein BFG57_00410 [Bacillus solimangrovi]|uniref:Ketosynthase family 3 (KS3) domain-containing protein n=1 Tax=Bacillus solimangrovi TaxID=1305675 RepID=A0A1E5LHW6_9BACI|nr:hypothetical protein BFG57_00410 [Bacillus solimangrovi]
MSNETEFKSVLEKGLSVFSLTDGLNEEKVLCGIVDDQFDEVNGVKLKKYPRATRMAIAAAFDAYKMSEIDQLKNKKRIAVVFGSSSGNFNEIEEYVSLVAKDQYRKFPPTAVGKMNASSIASGITSFLGLNGLSFTVSNSCTSSLDAVNIGKLLIESNQADICIVGGVDSTICKTAFYGYSKLKILSLEEDLEKIGGPFQPGSGFIMSEGAGAIILERESEVMDDNKEILGYIDGIHANQDGMSIFHSDTSGENMLTAVKNTVREHTPTYVNSQALGILENDNIEEFVHTTLFDGQVPITSIKGMIGHAFGASGILQCIASLISMKHSFIPPTTHSSQEKYEKLPLVKETKYVPVDSTLITNHGYGGNNTSLLLSKV